MAESLTYRRLLETMAQVEHLMPPRAAATDFLGMPVFVAPEFPKIRLNYRCRTKYGDEFELLTPKQQAETDAWLLATFGTTCAIPPGTAYVMSGMFGQGLHLNPRDVVKLNF